jgi:hypothetical protein
LPVVVFQQQKGEKAKQVLDEVVLLMKNDEKMAGVGRNEQC